ncbi:MAG: hypothetical protein Q9202_006909 [Teloschistes flavicans]
MAKAIQKLKTMGSHKKPATSRGKAADQFEQRDVKDDPAAQESSFPFLKLPNEIKDMIYRYCLVVKGAISPYPAYYQSRAAATLDIEGLNLALLRVCKSVAVDAKKILFGENVWHLTQEKLDLPMQSLWKQVLEQPHQPPLGGLFVFFDSHDLDHREALDFMAPPGKAVYDLRPACCIAPPPAAAPALTREEWTHFVSKIWSWKINIIRALLDRNLIAKKLVMNFTFAEGASHFDRWTDLIVNNDRWLKDYVATRSGRRIKKHASTKAENMFPGSNVKVEATYVGLSDEDEVRLFKSHGFRGQFL